MGIASCAPTTTSHTSPMGIDNHDTFTGLTQLQSAAADGNIDKVIELLDAGADADIQANGENAGKTAAMIAASNSSTEILKAIGRGPSLLNQGCGRRHRRHVRRRAQAQLR